MAIHVRHRREVLRKIRNRLIATAAAVSFVSILASGITLYLVHEYRRITLPKFTAVPYIPDAAMAQLERQDKPSHSSSSQKLSGMTPQIQPSVVVADTVSAVSVAELDVLDGSDFDAGEYGASGGLAGGLGDFGGLGDGAGNGHGSGAGEGDGRGAAARRRFGVGKNDDIQIVLALDASGSMDFLFREVSDSMGRMMAVLSKSKMNGRKARVNVGVVAYGAQKDNGMPWKVTDFTTAVEHLRREVAKVSCNGSEECCGAAISFAMTNFAWNRRENANALKVIIVAGNEPFDQGAVDYHALIPDLKASDIILNTVHTCSGYESENEKNSWREPAQLGGGVALTIQGAGTPESQQGTQDYVQAVRALVAVPVMPLGGPAEQEMHRARHQRLVQSLPAKEADIAMWMTGDGSELLEGFAWDAVEICRRCGGTCTLADLGGRGNLPAELRGLHEEEALRRLQELAAQRAAAVQAVKEQLYTSADLCSQILRVLRQQARRHGIDMKL